MTKYEESLAEFERKLARLRAERPAKEARKIPDGFDVPGFCKHDIPKHCPHGCGK